MTVHFMTCPSDQNFKIRNFIADQWLSVGLLTRPRAMMQIVEQSGMILISGGTTEWLEIWEIDDIGVLSHNRGQGFQIAINHKISTKT